MMPPRQIDEADVLEWAWSDTPFGTVPPDAGENGYVIHGLAICQYRGATDVYRFSCNAHWETVQDQVYNSIEEAKQELPDQYRHAPANWRIMDAS